MAAPWLPAAGVIAGPAFAAPPAVRLLAAEPAAVRFAVEVPEIRLEPVAGDSSLATLVIPGYDAAGRPGTAALPARVVMVAVPPSGTIQVRVTGLATETREGVRLAAIPWVPRAPAWGADRAPATGPATGVEATAAARLLGASWMRDQRVARIAIAPAAWDPDRQRLTVHHRIEVEVELEPGASAIVPSVEEAGFEPLYRETLVNYEQGRAWRRPAATRVAALGASPNQGASPANAQVVPDNSLFAGRDWVKIAIPQAGFYRVEFGQVRKSALFGGRDSTRLDSLRLFTWPGVPVLPENSYCDSCDYREVAIGFIDFDNDTLFHNNKDYFYFFALGPSDWADLYDPAQPDTAFINHPYETRNFVYLTIDSAAQPLPGPPRRIGTESVGFTPGDTLATPTPATFVARAHHEEDSGGEYWPDASPVIGVNLDGSYRLSSETWEKFFWASLSRGGQFTEPFDLPGLAPALPVRLRARVWGLSALIEGVSKSPAVSDHYLDVTGPIAFPRRGWNGFTPQTFDSTAAGLAETGNSFAFQVAPVTDPLPRFNPRLDRVGMAWFDVFYPRRFVPVGNELAFDSDPAGGAWLYKIGPFSVGPDSMPRVFDVSDPLAPIELTSVDYRALGPGEWEMRFRRAESGRRRYRVIPDWSGGSKIVKPPNSDVVDASSASRQNLRRPVDDGGEPVGADYLLIYYDGFKAAADTLRRWRREHLPMAGRSAPYDTFSVPISALYDQFSGGRTDPAAIRNFLRAAYTYWSPRPSFVTFLGDASFDFKNLKGEAPAGTPGSLVPSYENGFDDIVARKYASDDWMLNVDDPVQVVPDFYGGRIPAGDAASAMSYVRDKLLSYERAAPLGEWRDRVMLIADDNEQGSQPDAIYWGHLEQTARLDRFGLPPEVDRLYVYLHTYPDGPNDTKPGAKADILRNLADGVVMFNYIGHGSPFQITDESVFIEPDAGALTNKTRPSVFVAASCDVGKYDDPTVTSMGERLVLNPNGGTIAVVSATELAFSNINAALNLNLYQQLFRRDAASGQFEIPLAQGLLAAKSGSVNNQKYQLMGDAAMRLALPRLYVETVVRDLSGNPASEVQRGQTLQLTGRILDRPGGAPVTLDGLARLLIEDSAPIDTTPACFGSCVTYPFRAAPIFRGDAGVTAGQFATRFVVPMDGRLGPSGRARGYAELSSGAFVTDGAGSVAFGVAGGTPPAGDREGPRITLSFRGGSISVRPDAELRVDLFDPSGILITGRTPQNGIIVTLDDNSTQRYDITPSFRYAANSYQSGTALFRLPGLPAGPHRIKVTAADNLAAGIVAPDHRSAAAIDFEVTDNPALRVTRAILFPDPVRSGGGGSGGQFVVDAPGDSINVLLRIYTVAGRLVRRLESQGGLAQVQIPWDGLDAEGSSLARGVYLFKVQVYPREPDGRSSSRQRAEGEGRFVVVGR